MSDFDKRIGWDYKRNQPYATTVSQQLQHAPAARDADAALRETVEALEKLQNDAPPYLSNDIDKIIANLSALRSPPTGETP